MKVRLTVPPSIVKAATRSNMKDSPSGSAMHAAMMHGELVNRGGFGPVVMVEASPEAWEALYEWARRTGRTVVGDSIGRRNAAARSWRMADRLRRQLDRLAAHPAYRGLSVLGSDTVVLPARQKAGDIRWWPTVRMAMESPHGDPAELLVAELEPQRTTVRGRVFTTWTARPSSSVPTARREVPQRPGS